MNGSKSDSLPPSSLSFGGLLGGFGELFDPPASGSFLENPPILERSEPRGGRDFSLWNREMRDQIDPDTQERVLLLTKKQFTKQLLNDLKGFDG